MCHTIQGTMARASVGPDLTHIASRPLIGGVLPNTRGNLAGWVVDPQRIKPGVRMPMNPIRPDDLDPLLDYLESLK
jgi:cytochrome c oxidase subunit 2